MNQPPSKRIHEIRIDFVIAIIWFDAEPTGTRYGVSFARVFKHGESGQQIREFRSDALLPQVKAADAALDWI